MPVAAARKLLKCLVGLAMAWGTGAWAAPETGDSLAAADASGVPMLTRFNAEHYSVMPQHNAIATDARANSRARSASVLPTAAEIESRALLNRIGGGPIPKRS